MPERITGAVVLGASAANQLIMIGANCNAVISTFGADDNASAVAISI